MSWQRHFLAVLPDGPARAALAGLPVPAGARAVDPVDLHLTLVFLGTLDEAGEAAALATAAGLAVRPELQGLVARLEAVEFWPGPAVLCAVAGEGPDPLGGLAQALLAGLSSLPGLPPAAATEERPFRSHVTLARRAPRASPRHAPLATPIAWPVRELVLMASRAGADRAPRYGVRGRCPFQYEGTR